MDFLSIHLLLSIFVAVLIIICCIIVFSVFFKKEKVLKNDTLQESDKESTRKKEFSFAEMYNTRIWEGAIASEHYAQRFETHLIDCRVSMVDCISANNKEYIANIMESGERISKYRKLSEFNKKAIPPEKPDLFVMLIEFSKEGTASKEKPNLPIHECLLRLADVLSHKKLLIITKVLENYQTEFLNKKIANEQFFLLAKTLSDMSKSAIEVNKLFESNEQKNRQIAVEKSILSFKRAHDDLQSAKPDKGRSEIVTEIVYLKSLITKMLTIAKQAEIDEAWKPDFFVEFPYDQDHLEADHRIIPLSFKIINKNHELARIPGVDIQVNSLSHDLEPEKANRTLSLASGEADLTVIFRSFAMDTDNSDTKPTIRFLLTYRIRGKEFRYEKEIELPKIIVREKITNPFKDGIAGKALPGDSRLFTGRDQLLMKISREMLDFKSAPLFYILHGHPRSGKTSIVKQLAENPNWLKKKFIYIWTNAELIQDPANYYEDMFSKVREILREQFGIHLRKIDEHERYKDIPWLKTIDLLRLHAKEIRDRKKKLLLVIDEYQKMAIWDEFSDKDKKNILVSNHFYLFPEFIKIVRDEYDDLMTIVMDGQLSLEEIETSGSQGRKWIQLLGGRLNQKNITNFEPKEADEMLIRQFNEYDIQLSNNILDRVKLYTVCHPWLHMLMGYHLFEQMIDETGYFLREDREIKEEDVDLAALKIKGADIKFAWVEPWLLKDFYAQVFLAALGDYSYRRSQDGGDLTEMPVVTLEDINDFLYIQLDLEPGSFNFDAAIPKLIKNHLIHDIGKRGRRFKLHYPLYAIFAHKTGQIHEVLNKKV